MSSARTWAIVLATLLGGCGGCGSGGEGADDAGPPDFSDGSMLVDGAVDMDASTEVDASNSDGSVSDDAEERFDSGVEGRNDGAADGALGDGSAADGALGDGSASDGSTGDGSTGDGSAGDGSTMSDGSTGGDGSTMSDGSTDGDGSTMMSDADVSSDAMMMLGDSSMTMMDSGPPPADDVIINELVFFPVNDWSRSDNGGDPFVSPPGNGLISSTDQYVELKNVDIGPVDLTGWTLEIRDPSPTTTTIGLGSAQLIVSPGSTPNMVLPGDFMVIGNPEGFASTDAWVILRDPWGRVIDEVEIGGFVDERDFEEDGIADGAPVADRNAFGRGAFEEAIARPAGAPDTGNDIDDFVAMVGTPLAENIAPAPPVESTPPTVVSNSSGSSFAVSQAITITMSEPINALTADIAIALRADGNLVALDPQTYQREDSVIVINPIGVLPHDADIEVTVRGGAAGVRDIAGNAMVGDHVFMLHTEPAPPVASSIRINEICADPQQDWNDSSGGDGVAFSSMPGDGRINSEDEWIELLVSTPGPVDLSGYRIILYSGFSYTGPVREFTNLGGHSFIQVFGAGELDAAVNGDRIIVGNPRAAIIPSSVVELRAADGTLVDTVELGGNDTDNDRGGDGIRNGAPAPNEEATSTGLSDEVVARIPDGTDTGSDVGDFDRAAATLGSTN